MSPCPRRKSILLICPGLSGRALQIKIILEHADIVVMVPAVVNSQWVLEQRLVTKENWIEIPNLTDFDAARKGLESWRAANSNHHLDGVMAYDQFALPLLGDLVDYTGLPGTPLSVVKGFMDKSQFRQICADNGVPAIQSINLTTVQDLDDLENRQEAFPFPAVLKPRRGAGSWHITKVTSYNELRRVWSEIMSNPHPKGSPDKVMTGGGFILEEFFEGDEVDVDGWAYQGRVGFSMVNDNRPALEPQFQEVGGTYPSQLSDEVCVVLQQLTQKVLDGLGKAGKGYFHGVFHFEAKIDVKTLRCMPIEFNGRLGGAECPASVEAVSGIRLAEVAARVAVGENLKSTLMPFPRRCSVVDTSETESKRYAVCSSANLYADLEGMLTEFSQNVDADAVKLVNMTLYSENVGKYYLPGNGSKACLGWVSCGGANVEEAQKNLQETLSSITVKIGGHVVPQIILGL